MYRVIYALRDAQIMDFMATVTGHSQLQGVIFSHDFVFFGRLLSFHFFALFISFFNAFFGGFVLNLKT